MLGTGEEEGIAAFRLIWLLKMRTFIKHSIHCTLLLALAATDPVLRVTYAENPEYTYGAASPGGTGKYYMGREISQVMGHQGAQWLERPERERQEQPSRLIESLAIAPGQSVADIGAGTGYFTWRLTQAVGQQGRVFAVDIQPQMLEKLELNMSRRDIQNYYPVLGSASDPGLSDQSLDLALMVDVYHEFSHPAEMLDSLRRALKPGGRLVAVEYRAEDPTVPIKRLHKMSEEQIIKEGEASNLEYVKTVNVLPRQHIIIFRRPHF